jgi:2-polyprenyl-6-methoxyphenol hydroxylase-like FAD-dependent oxidoreductase
MARPGSEYDVVVIGGGPAGAAVGRLLAAWGHAVLVLTKPIDEARGLAESLPPSTRKLLAAVGVLEAVEAAGFYRTTGNTVWWGASGASDGRVETFDRAGEDAASAGYQVFRPQLDRLLIERAGAAGARVLIGASVKRVEADEPGGMSHVEFEHDGRLSSASARFVLDCSGRAGVIARQGYRRYETGHRMQALIGIWECTRGWDLPDETHTVVETYEDGWAWSVPVSPSRRHVGAMVNGATTKLTRASAIAEVYKSELVKTRQLDARMRTADASLRHVWACDASLYSAHTYADASRQALLVGDAGAFIDPLSSFGVKKALASAWIAAVAVHTSLRDAGRKQIALDFFSSWERQVYTTHLQQTRDFARRAYTQHPSAFWAARADAVVTTPAATIDDGPQVPHEQATIEQILMRDPAVRHAFDAFKHSASLQLAWADSIRFEKRALIRDREIVLEDAVPLPSARTCLRYLGNVDLLKLGEMACEHRQVPDLYEAYCRTQTPVSLPHLLGGLSLLVANGVLTHRSPSHDEFVDR